jgi:hypothetical protein
MYASTKTKFRKSWNAFSNKYNFFHEDCVKYLIAIYIWDHRRRLLKRILIKCCILKQRWAFVVRLNMLNSNVIWEHQLMISKRWLIALIWCSKIKYIIIWLHETRTKSNFQLNVENSSFNNSLHSSLFMSLDRSCLNINYWSKNRSRFLHASIYLSSSRVYHAITKCRNDCIKKKIYWSKTCILIEDEIEFINLTFHCIILFFFVDLKELFLQQ